MASHLIRRGSVLDLEALVALEATGFATDRFNRRQLRRLLDRARATIFVLEAEGCIRGSAIVLWRRDTTVGRLYSIVVDPQFQGSGFGAELLNVCSQEAVERGCHRLSLEVRTDNEKAIRFYAKRGFHKSEDLADYYGDGIDVLRMVAELQQGQRSVRLRVPYFAQTLDFTCGSACLLMAMSHFDPQLEVDRTQELMLWKEATTIFMTSGLGGCGPFGLALAARRRGFAARVMMADRATPFLSSVRSADKKEVIRLVHRAQEKEALRAGVLIQYIDFSFADVSQALSEDEIPIVLVNTYGLHRFKAPHWVVLTGFDGDNVYFNDPDQESYTGEAQDVRIPLQTFQRMRDYGSELHRSAVFIGGKE